MAVFADIGIFASGAAELELPLSLGMETLRVGWKMGPQRAAVVRQSAKAIQEGI